jgi:osmoprotectant transport system substrate-binding protein
MRTRTKIFAPLAASVLLLGLAACGESGSSGTGGDAAASSSSGGSGGGKQDCAPVAGDKLVVLDDDKQLQNADNVIPAVNAKASNDALLANLNAVSSALTTDELVSLNAAVDVERKTATDVAQGWVDENIKDGDLQKGSGSIKVGGANFTESTVLANVYADVLKKAGYDASVKEVGNRELYLKALEAGDIQVFPEYLSTFTEFLDGDESRQVASGDVQKTLEALKPLAEKVGLTVGEPSDAADQNAFAVTTAFADKLGVKTLSELGEACGSGLILGGPTECPDRPFCQPGLEKTYGLTFDSFRELDAGGPLTKTALEQGQISIGLVFSSDGALAAG